MKYIVRLPQTLCDLLHAKLNNNLPQEPIKDTVKTFESARAWVHGLRLRSAAEWQPYVASIKRDPPLGGARSRRGR